MMDSSTERNDFNDLSLHYMLCEGSTWIQKYAHTRGVKLPLANLILE
jgi:hypothetical protein